MSDEKKELRGLYESLQAEREALLAKTVSMRAERDALREKMQPLERQLQEMNKAINAIERPRLAEIDNQLGPLAVALGGKRLSQGAAENGVV